MSHPFIVGYHTRHICSRLTQAVVDYQRGVSSFIVVRVPFRHGKTDIVSRALPAFFLGQCAHMNPEVIMTGYGAQLVESFSRRTKAIIRSNSYRTLFPEVEISHTKDAASQWGLAGSTSEVTAVGLGGSITGRGGDLIVIDDYCKKREEAESEAYRRRVWDAFTDDVMTRRAPTCIVVVCATPWHVGDLIGLIEKEMKDNADFPRFEFLTFPARSERYPSGHLFPQRFSLEWYSQQFATLGPYASAGLLQCDPIISEGTLFKVDNIRYVDSLDSFPDSASHRYVRAWDLASTEKERAKDDPDSTVGSLVCLTKEGIVPTLWIADMKVCQSEAPKRNEMIRNTAILDGLRVRQVVEAVGGYKDAFHELKRMLTGISTVERAKVSGDKVVRNSVMEPLFAAGNVVMLKSDWNARAVDELAKFPFGTHDDTVDSLGHGTTYLLKPDPGIVVTR